MKITPFTKTNFARIRLFAFVFLAALMFSLVFSPQSGFAQQARELSLADVIIGLRSNKVTLPERNDILAEAVKERGITFELTAEIQKELEQTGANENLIQAIKQNKMIVKAASIPTPKPTPANDFTFYQNQANDYFNKGELDLALANYNKSIQLNPKNADAYMKRGQIFYRNLDFDSAIADFNKAIELNPTNTIAYTNRGQAFHGKKNYDLAIADYDKVVELNPRDITAYFYRSESYEKKGDLPNAIADFKKIVEFDKENDFAKKKLQSLEDEQAKLLQKEKEAEIAAAEARKQKEKEAAKEKAQADVVSAKPTPIKPEFVNVGYLDSSKAIDMATPVYPMTAKSLKLSGKVIVEIEFNEEGNVTSAKATEGHKLLRTSCEQAALKSKFTPALFDGEPIKAKGYVIYKFVR